MRVSALFLVLLLSLSACYRPLYGPKNVGEAQNAAEARLNNISISPIDDRNGQVLRNFLIDRFYGEGRPVKPSHDLRITLHTAEDKLGLQKDATTTRARLTVDATCNMYDISTAKLVWTGIIHSTVSYDILDQQYANLSAQENAYARALRDVADQITRRVLLSFNGKTELPPVKPAKPLSDFQKDQPQYPDPNDF